MIRRSLLLALGLVLPVSSSWQGQNTLVLNHVTVVDVVNGRNLPDMTVFISQSRITAIEQARTSIIPRGADVIDASGKFVIPGLWDMHVHLTLAGAEALPVLVANGVTSVRDMGGDFDVVRTWREATARGDRVGPRIVAAGPVFESARFMELLRQIATMDTVLGKMIADITATRFPVGTEDEAHLFVDSVASLGGDFVKLRNVESPEVYRAILEAASQAGLPVVGHQPTVVGLREASDWGQRTIEHAFLGTQSSLSEGQRAELFRRVTSNGTAFVPTLIATVGYRLTPDSLVLAIVDDTLGLTDARRLWVSELLAEQWRMQTWIKRFEGNQDHAAMYRRLIQDLQHLHDLGAPVMVGTDLGAPLVFPGFSVHDELGILVEEVGMSPTEALASASHVPAASLAMQDSIGSVELGKIADLVVLDGDPTQDIRNVQRIHAVILRGKLFDRKALDQLLADAREHANAGKEER